MTQPNTDTALDTLEKFNNPENFLATRKTFDVNAFMKHRSDRHQYVREDGVLVRQYYFENDGYQEELSRPDSHYEYSYGFYKNGRLKGMDVRFCHDVVGEGLWFDEAGNIIKRQNFDESYLPIPTLRERFLEQTQTDKEDKATGVDIYDTSKVFDVHHAKFEDDTNIYYNIFVRQKPGRTDATSYLLDGESGTILYYIDTYWGDGGQEFAYGPYMNHLRRIGKTHQEYLELRKSREQSR